MSTIHDEIEEILMDASGKYKQMAVRVLRITLWQSRLLALALPALLTCLARADQVDAIVLRDLKTQHVPGAWVLVRKDGKIVKRAGYGISNLEDRTKTTTRTLMQTGSVGKMFTAEGILLLVRDGKLKLDDSLASFFPGCPDWWKPITIRHLLQHTAGIPDYEREEPPIGVDLRRDYSDADFLAFFEAMKPEFAPGDKWDYSNTDYVLLGLIIKKLTGKFYADFLAERLFKPLGMPTMRPINDREVIVNRSAGYEWEDGKWLNQAWVSASMNATADGALYATPDDFAAWDRALDSYSVLPKAQQDEAWTSGHLNNGQKTYYGFGWLMGERLGHRWIGHLGAWQGFLADYVRYTDDRLSVAVFCNCDAGDPNLMATRIAEAYLPALAYRSQRALPDPQHLTEDAKRILTDLAEGRRVAYVPPGAQWRIDRLVRRKFREGKHGALRKIELVRQSSTSDGEELNFRATYDDGIWGVILTRDSKGAYKTFRIEQ